MPGPDERAEWAKELCVEAFRECGVKLGEDDSIILVAAVFRRALDAWLRESEDQLLVYSTAVEGIAEEFKRYLKTAMDEELVRIKKDLNAANYSAEQAVLRALRINGKDSHWKYRMEGIGIGVVLVVLGVCIALLRR